MIRLSNDKLNGFILMTTTTTSIIFISKFMPHSGDNIVISGAADSEIRVHEVSRKETFHVLRYHSSRVKRIATSRDQPHVFWSASEDGTVMLVA